MSRKRLAPTRTHQTPPPQVDEKPTPTCGDHGGRSLQGDHPCTREAGWGTDHRGKGRCNDHDEKAEAERQRLKSRFLEDFRTGKMSRQKAADNIGVGATQVWRWAVADPVFAAQVRQAEEESDGHRVSMVEDSMFARIIAGKANAAETIFFLVNRSNGRWKHIQQTIQHTGPGGGPVQVESLSAEERASRVSALLATAASRAEKRNGGAAMPGEHE